jgi:hypothetical protein
MVFFINKYKIDSLHYCAICIIFQYDEFLEMRMQPAWFSSDEILLLPIEITSIGISTFTKLCSGTNG